MKIHPSSAIENGLTAQLMKSVTPNAARMRPDPAERGEVDLQQHRNDHHPDEDADRDVDLGDFERRDRPGQARHQRSEDDAGDDATRLRG
jgi:hypothetical protein